ncbi:hypothetical protein Trydic_g17827 [Trypoxylus dichotomus]
MLVNLRILIIQSRTKEEQCTTEYIAREDSWETWSWPTEKFTAQESQHVAFNNNNRSIPCAANKVVIARMIANICANSANNINQLLYDRLYNCV